MVQQTRKTRASSELLIMVIPKEKLLAKLRLIKKDWQLLVLERKRDDAVKGATLLGTASSYGME